MASERYFEILLSRAVPQVFGADYALLAQQLTLPSGRLDLLLKHQDGTKHVVEVKKDRAKPNAVDQVIRYVKDFAELGSDTVTGWVVANQIPRTTADYASDNGIHTQEVPEKAYAQIMSAAKISELDLLGQRIEAGVLIGGGSQTFKTPVALDVATKEMPPELRDHVMQLYETGLYQFPSGKMQTAIVYKGVKLGGINRKHKHNFISSNIILSPADEDILRSFGFERITKTQASSSHMHVYWTNKIDDVLALGKVLEHFSHMLDVLLFE